ncbi:MAG: hypothetical protein IPI00_01355 [Flavobacteriales bacterium]|nr:hypothetical protein [Flavobacteriales bacterium]MBK6946214.1 hypothetical protein [Flavobacteriales bacterium]MBK7238834.1 hypothetical protein [Flavobacteriales bacterium]MBK7297594.1 hypothetical protein [Flavobacteriales bacterium]MBK9537041.1 hypothetical protein [Flavobacteriales bacterium]
MNNSLVRIIYCSALVSATGVANAQFNFSASPTDTERFSLLQHDQRLNESGHFGATTLPRIPSSYDHNALGLFCKLDVQFEKRLKIPVFFRLGDAQSIAAWEGKGVLRKR